MDTAVLGKKIKRSGLEIGTKMVHIGGGIILGGRPGSSQVHLRARVSDARSTRYFRVPTSAIYYYRPTENVYFRALQRQLRWAKAGCAGKGRAAARPFAPCAARVFREHFRKRGGARPSNNSLCLAEIPLPPDAGRRTDKPVEATNN